MSTTVSYKGQTLTTVSNDTKTLLTEGKYLEDDITLVDVSGGGAVLGTKNIATNGTYEAEDDSLDGYSEVTVAVPASAVDSGTKNITANGNGQDVVGYAAVNVNVPNSYSAGDEGKVVSNGSLVAQTSDTVTANDTYDTTLINSLTVNVSGGGGGSVLPPEYYELSHVFFNSGDAAYIATNYTPERYDELYLSFSIHGWNNPVISSGTGTYQLIVLPYMSGNQKHFYFRYFSSGSASDLTSTIEMFSNSILTVDANGNATLKNGGNTYTGASTYGGSTNDVLYVGKRAGQASYFSGEVSSLKITNNGVDKLILVPAMRKQDNEVGFYDTVSNTFYTNAGSGMLYAGEILVDDSEALSILLGGA